VAHIDERWLLVKEALRDFADESADLAQARQGWTDQGDQRAAPAFAVSGGGAED
jgi:hypothetical protein